MTQTTNALIHQGTDGSIQDRVLQALLADGLVTEADLSAARDAKQHGNTKRSLLFHLIEAGSVSVPDALQALASEFHLPVVDLTAVTPEPAAISAIDSTTARDRNAIPFRLDDDELHVAVLNPSDLDLDREIEALTDLEVQIYVADEYSLFEAIKLHYANNSSVDLTISRDASDVVAQLAKEKKSEDTEVKNAEIPRLVDRVLRNAVQRGASDIHIEIFRNVGRIRFRIDGSLIEISNDIDPRLGPAIANRIKVQSQLNSTQSRVPEDGSMSMEIDGQIYDFRVATLPTTTGQDVTLRILENEVRFADLYDLNMAPTDTQKLHNALSKTQGMILVTGPTGSGKSTTLYTALGMLNDGSRKILTVEDPVEREVSGIVQVNVRPHDEAKLNLDYARALRSFLRHDPDIIMVGEIRDAETAQTAMRASMTGHLVLSTLHTNDTAATVQRLRDIGVPAANIVAAVRLIVAQRLVRTICRDCKAEYTPTARERAESGFSDEELAGVTFYRGTGCQNCSQTGFRGRIGIYEVMDVTRDLRNAIMADASDDEIRDVARREGITTLRKSGFERLVHGETTLAEVGTQIAF